MNLPRVLEKLRLERMSVMTFIRRFLVKLPLEQNKKMRLPICNSNHWTVKYFKVKGVLTVSETFYYILDYSYTSWFATWSLFESFCASLFKDILPNLLMGSVLLVLAFETFKNELDEKESLRRKYRRKRDE